MMSETENISGNDRDVVMVSGYAGQNYADRSRGPLQTMWRSLRLGQIMWRSLSWSQTTATIFLSIGPRLWLWA